MTDISLYIKDEFLRRLIRLEFERLEKNVSDTDLDGTVFITDFEEALLQAKNNQILLSYDEISHENAFVLRRPVDMGELRATVSQIFTQIALKSDQPLRSNTVSLLKEEKSAIVGALKIALTENEFLLLSALMEKDGDALSRDEINSLLKSSGNTPEVYICGLRKKLSFDNGINTIITVRGKGYKLNRKDVNYETDHEFSQSS